MSLKQRMCYPLGDAPSCWPPYASLAFDAIERYSLALRLLREERERSERLRAEADRLQALLLEERERSERLGEAPSRGSHRHFNGAGMCIRCLHEDTPGDLPPCRDCTMTVHALGWEPK